MFAAHHRLDNLVALIDLNGMQALGPTADDYRHAPDGRSLAGLRLARRRVDGHDLAATALGPDRRDRRPDGARRRRLPHGAGQGRLVHGGTAEWHYRNLSRTWRRRPSGRSVIRCEPYFMRHADRAGRGGRADRPADRRSRLGRHRRLRRGFPGRFLNVGVAEQNMAGVATGLPETA